MAAPDFEVLRINKTYLDSLTTVSPDYASTNFRKEFQAPDSNIYVISGNEEKAVPGAVGIAWRAADGDLELVSRG